MASEVNKRSGKMFSMICQRCQDKRDKQALVRTNLLRKFIVKCEYVIGCEAVSYVSLLTRWE